jgi:flavin reductase (DIM6/NTAB) family NADH-FMN oxidoreductase RutF
VREAGGVKVDPGGLSPDAAYFWQVATVVPRPIAWTSTLNEDGTTNLAPFSFFTAASSDPPMCIICVSRKKAATAGGQREKKDTWRNIERTGEYVIHVVTGALVERMNLTSKDHPYGTDELALAGLSPLPSERVAPPRIAEAPVAMECRLERIVEVGRSGTAIIIGEILLWHVADELIVGGRIDMAKLDAVGRMAGAVYARTRDRFEMPRPK